jgi:hypothetical protein
MCWQYEDEHSHLCTFQEAGEQNCPRPARLTIGDRAARLTGPLAWQGEASCQRHATKRHAKQVILDDPTI